MIYLKNGKSHKGFKISTEIKLIRSQNSNNKKKAS